ncbi:50S ribosomal protein L6, partial [Candidatus Woesearchaeota archaeon]|nr:50S ribosomal protein L6 [Candidatus Woesearchaeota archaeon]
VQQPYTYLLKICSGHFPINVSVNGNQFIVKNFLGEKYPRTMTIKQGAKVTIQGDKITVESPDKEKAGQTSSEIELLTRISKRDPRVFQDGIYLVQKAGEQIA